jgi:hypothetical protein
MAYFEREIMKITKATDQDIDAAGNAMFVLNDISSGYYPARSGGCAPTFFDPDDKEHLRKFYDLMNATLHASPGWPGRIIAAMCYVILPEENEILDPVADTLELHPKLAAAHELLEALQNMVEMFKTVPTLEQNSFDEPPEPKTQWDYEAYQMIGAACAAIAKAEGRS